MCKLRVVSCCILTTSYVNLPEQTVADLTVTAKSNTNDTSFIIVNILANTGFCYGFILISSDQ